MKLQKHLWTVFLILVGYSTIIFISPLIGAGFTFCPIKNLTGVDCPSCGLGKASTLLFSGNIDDAMNTHFLVIPINFLIIAYCLVVIYNFIMKNSELVSILDGLLSNRKLLSVLGIVLIINWIISSFLKLTN